MYYCWFINHLILYNWLLTRPEIQINHQNFKELNNPIATKKYMQKQDAMLKLVANIIGSVNDIEVHATYDMSILNYSRAYLEGSFQSFELANREKLICFPCWRSEPPLPAWLLSIIVKCACVWYKATTLLPASLAFTTLPLLRHKRW